MQIEWALWEALIQERGLAIDRPRGSSHPRYPDTTYPLDYGYIPQTVGGDGAEVDVFVGTAATGLRAALLTRDGVKGDEELKLLWNVSEAEAEIARRFVHHGAMAAALIWRDEDDPTARSLV